MTEAPSGPHRGDGRREHPIDAAVRGARRGPPAAYRPSGWFTWGWRTALLLPAVVLVLAGLESVAAPADGARGVLAGVMAVALVAIIAHAWWLAGQPRLDTMDGPRIASDLGKENSRRLGRALRRGEPVPAELQPWAAAYLRTQENSMLPGMLGTASGTANMLLFLTGPRGSSTEVVVVVLVLGTGALVVLGAVATMWLMRHNARRLGLPIDAGERAQ